jgi:voltage-gated potassium channel
MVAGVTVLAVVCVVGILGYAAAGWTVTDGLYMVVITIFGVGYGEVRPVDTWPLRTLTGFVIVAGYGAVIYTVGGFIQLVVDGQLNRAFGARRMKKDIDRLHEHTVICGIGRMGTTLAAELSAAGHDFVAIDTDPEALDRAEQRGGLVLFGDATDELVLEAAGIHRAATLATVLSDDATNVYVTLTARAMNPDLTIIARGEDRNAESKLVRCGADRVVLPTDIGATRISQLIVRPTAEQMLEELATSGDMDLMTLGLEFDEIRIPASSPWVGHSIGELEVRGSHGYLIVGIRKADGTTSMNPPADLRLAAGDRMIVLGYHDDIPELGTRTTARPAAAPPLGDA